MDLVHDATRKGRRMRMLAVIDDHTKLCLGIEVDSSISGHRVSRILDNLVELHGKPDRIHSDNGPEFAGMALDQWSYRNGVKHTFIQPGKPQQNCYVERFNGKLRVECLNEHWFDSVGQAREIVEKCESTTTKSGRTTASIKSPQVNTQPRWPRARRGLGNEPNH